MNKRELERQIKKLQEEVKRLRDRVEFVEIMRYPVYVYPPYPVYTPTPYPWYQPWSPCYSPVITCGTSTLKIESTTVTNVPDGEWITIGDFLSYEGDETIVQQ
jgi:hypothetical protein